MRENDIVFFNLHRRYLNNVSEYGGFLGIFYLAAFLNKNGYFAQGFSGQFMEGKRLIDEICQENKVSMIGLYCDYDNVTENIFLSRYIKEQYKIPVIIGGPQATALTKDFMDKSCCDVIVRYEGELTVLELVHYFLDEVGCLDAIKGIMYKKDNEVIIQSEQPIIENLDKLPFIDEECYLKSNGRDYELSIMTGRGCPFHCTFCHEGHHTRKVRFRSVENVLLEIERFLQKRKHIKNLYVLFTDDTFTLIPDRVKKLCQGLKKLQDIKNFKWFCEGHIHTLYLHPEMIDYIAQAGCKRIQLGIEAGTQNVLDAYQKGSTLDEIRFVVQKCEQAGIQQLYSNIILGGPFFSEEIYKANLNFAKELLSIGKGIVEIAAVPYWPLPETTITNNPEKYCIKITDKDFLTSNGDFPQTETDKLTCWEINNMVKEMGIEIEHYMEQMLRNNEVPTERILSWFSIENNRIGRWGRCLKQLPDLMAYYEMLLSKEVNVSTDFSKEKLLEAHPIRVIPIGLFIEVIDDNTIKIVNCILKGIEKDILIYTAGKLSIKEIIEILSQKYLNKEVLKDNVLKTLDKLEKEHLLVYYKY